MKYDFIKRDSYDYADKSIPHIIDAPDDYKPFAVSRWPVAGQAIEFWFIREHKAKRKIRRRNGKGTYS